MKSSLYERAKMFLQAHRKKNIWYRLVSVLAVVVVFVTTYMLVLPAITMEHATYCGIEEHLHTAECYSRQYIFTCGQDESSGHEHTDDCLEAVSVLTCTKEEHYHTDECYAQPEQIEDGGAAEILADGGDGELIIDNTPEQEEFPELSFKDDPSVIDPNGAKNTASENETESETETEEETTEAAVYYCGREAHIHTDECFNEENEVICGKMTHQHTEECLKVPETEEETTEAETEAETEEAATEAVVEAEEETTEAAAIETEEATTEAAEPETEEATTEAAETETETTTPSAEPETESETETEEATTEAVQQPQMNSWGWGGAEGPGFEDNGVFVSGNRQNTTETDTETEDETESETESGSEIETETESESESETEPQYICGLEEHTHTEACYDEAGNLVCDLEEHTHTEECMAKAETEVETESEIESESEVETETESESESEMEPQYICGLEEHTHTGACYDEAGNLVCGLEEHTHTEECIGTGMLFAVPFSGDGMEDPSADDGIMTIAEQGIDFGEWITHVVFQIRDKATGQWKNVDSNTVIHEDDIVNFKITYSIPDNEENGKDKQDLIEQDGVMYFQMPAGITLKEAESGYVLDDGVTAGTYTIDKNGLITIKIDKEYLEKKSEISGSVQFNAAFKRNDSSSESEEHTFKIGDCDISVTVQPEEETVQDNSSLYTRKEGNIESTIVDGKTKTRVNYKIVVGTYNNTGVDGEGKPRDIIIHDYFLAGKEYLSVGGQVVIKVKSPDGKVEEKTVNINEDGFYLTLDALTSQGEYVLEYSFDVDADKAKLLQQQMSLHNKVEGSISNSNKFSSAEAWLSISNTWVDKYGEYSNGEITWIIDINKEGYNNLNGYVLSDKLPDGTEIKDGKVTLYNVTKGTQESITLPYTFTEDTFDVYRVEYSTTVGTVNHLGSETYTNSVEFKGPGGTYSDTAGVTVSSNLDIGKKYTNVQNYDSDGKQKRIDWETDIKVPTGGIKKGYVVTDWMDADLYMDSGLAAGLVVSGLSDGEKIPLIKGTDYTIEFFDEAGVSLGEAPSSGQIKSYKIVFKKDISASLYPHIYIDYSAIADVSGVPANGSQTYTNHVSISDGSNAKETQSSWTYDTSGMFKKEASKTGTIGGYGYSGDFTDLDSTWEYDQLIDGKIYYRVTADTKDSDLRGKYRIYDVLPEGLKLDLDGYGIRYSVIPADGGSEYDFDIFYNWSQFTSKDLIFSNKEELIKWLGIENHSHDNIVDIIIDKDKWQKVLDDYLSNAKYGLAVRYAAIIEDFDGVEKSFTNNAKLEINGSDYAEDSQTTTVIRRTMEKSSIQVTGNPYLDYTLIVNKDGTDLVMNSETLKVEDIATWPTDVVGQMVLVPELVKVYKYKPSNIKNNGDGTFSFTNENNDAEEIPQELWNYKASSADGKSEIDFNVPDGQGLIITYRYYVQAKEGINEGTKVSISNSAKILGTEYSGSVNDTDNGTFDVQKSSADISGTETAYSLSFIKVDQDNWSKRLSGAEYTLYQYVGTSAENTDPWKKVKTYRTEDGQFKIEKEDTDGDGTNDFLAYDTAYRLVETKAPEGYLCSEKPYDFYRLKDCKTRSELYNKFPGLENDFNPEVPVGTVTLTDIEAVQIDVQKHWEPLTPEGAEIEVQLHQSTTKPEPKEEETEPDAGEEPAPTEERTIIIKSTFDEKPWMEKEVKTTAAVGTTISYKVCILKAGQNFSYGANLENYISKKYVGNAEWFYCEYKLESEDNIITLAFTSIDHNYSIQNNIVTYYSDTVSWEISSDQFVGSEKPEPTPTPDEEDDPTAYGAPVTLKESSGWTHTWDNLPKTDEDGNLYYYWVDEKILSGEGYTLTGEKNNTGINSGVIELTNEKPPEKVNVEVEKHWINTNGELMDLPSSGLEITVNLYRKNADGSATLVNTATLTGANGWKYQWTGLDEALYYVEEIVPKGYTAYYNLVKEEYGGEATASDVTVPGGIIYINNWYTPHTSVTVKKKWLDRNDAELTTDLPESITVQLYRQNGDGEWDKVPKEEGGEVNLTESDSWSHTWENLPQGAYCVKETAPDGKWEITYQVEGDVSKTTAEEAFVEEDGGTITITNKKTDTEISVKKNWVGYDGKLKTDLAELTGLTITVELWKKGEGEGSEDTLQEGKTITLPGKPSASDITVNGTYSDDGWGFTWKDLPQGTYYVKETAVSLDGTDVKEKYDVTYSVEGSDGQPKTGTTITDGTTTYSGAESGTLMITNTEKHTSVSVEKVWQGPNGEDAAWTPPADGIQVQLYQKQADGSYVKYLPDGVGKQTLKAENEWKYTWENLPEGEYYVEETTKLTSYTVTYSSDGHSDVTGEEAQKPENFAVTGGKITITNTEEWKELEVYKEWDCISSDGDKQEIEVQLHSSTTPPDTNPSTLATVNLPTGTEPVTLARANASAAEGPGTAESTTSITLRVGYWLNGSNEHVQRPAAGWVKMQIWQCTADGQMLGNTPVATGTLSYENEWSVTARGLPGQVVMNGSLQPVSYFVKFEAGGAGNSIERVVLMNNLDSGCIVSGAVPSSELMLSAIIGEGTGMAAMSSYKTKSANQTINLPQGSQPIEGPATNVKLNASNSWHHKWEHLPKYNDEGEELYYSVQEVTNLDGFETTYNYGEYDSKKKITIINKKVVDVHVKKVWNGFDEIPYDNLKIHVQLLADGIAEKSAVLNQGNEWSCEWKGLPADKKYTVVEISVSAEVNGEEKLFSDYDNQITELADGNGYELTITNTYNPETYTLPETGGPGTLPYTVGGTLLTAFAALLLYIQNKRRKEGQGTS